jgi:tetratricopeptide (TPR) repeat protein
MARDSRRRPDRPRRQISAVAALAGVWLLALALRLIYLAELHGSPFFSVLIVDGRQYDAWAQQIASGQWLGSEVFYQTPLYPYLLACVYKIAGHHVMLVRIVQALLGACSCVLLGIAGGGFFGARVGLIAGLLLAIYPEAIFWDGLVQKSSLDLFLMTGLLAALGSFLTRPRRRWLVVAGVAMGALMLNRENARVLYPVVIVWLLAYFREVPVRRRLAWAAVVTGCIAALLLPVGVRNYAVGGEFLISTSQLGPNFYIGNHAGAAGTYEPLVPDHGNPLDEREDAKTLAEQAVGHPLSSGAVSDYWVTRAMGEIRAHPGAWIGLLGRKILLTMNAGEMVDTESMQEYSRYSRLLWAIRWFGFGIVLPLAILGAWITRRSWRSLALLYATATGLALSVVLFVVLSRYRFPLVPVVLLFAAAALAAMPAIRVQWRSWIPGVITAVAVGAVAHLPMTSASNTTHDNVGAELILEGRPAEAVGLLRAAVAIAPNDARAHYDLGIAFDRTGERDMSLDELLAAVRLKPDFAQAHDALGSEFRRRGRRAEALRHFADAVRLSPESAQVHLNYGVALWEAGEREAAIMQYQAALRVRPDDVAAHNNLAAALQQTGHSRDAISHYEAALRSQPDYAEAHSNLALALAEIGRTDDALDHFRTALALQPGNFGAHANFGDLLLHLGRTPEAILEYQAAVRFAPADVDTALTLLARLAQAYAKARRLTEAGDTFARAVALAHAAGRDDVAGQLERARLALRR